LAADLMSGALLAELPLGQVTFEQRLNSAGQFDASLALSGSAARRRVLLDATTPERTVVYAERDGVIVDGFVVWARSMSAGQPLVLRGASLWSLFARNRIVSTLTFAATDQLSIARAIVDHVQGQSGAGFGVVSDGAVLSGRVRDRMWPSWDRKCAGDAVSELASVQDGFDFAVECGWVGGVVERRLVFGYPRRGRSAGATGLRVVAGKNMTGWRRTEDGLRSARSVDVFGAGDAGDMLIATQTRTDLLDRGWPLTWESRAHKDVTVQATLDAHASAYVAARAATPAFWEFDVSLTDPDIGVGSWVVGDDVLVEFDEDADPLLPDGYRGWHRIVTARISVDDLQSESCTLVMGDVVG
jgi:hypothetical protein